METTVQQQTRNAVTPVSIAPALLGPFSLNAAVSR